MARVQVDGVGKSFGHIVAVDDVTLRVESGAIVGLLGPSGCGKTTFLRLIAGFETADVGTITVSDRVVNTVKPEDRHVGFVFQDYALFPHMTVAANVGAGLHGANEHRLREVLDLVGLSGMDQRYPHELSGGQQQRVALARALAPAPAVILMDEPFSNLDADLRTRVRAEVRAILKAAGATVIFVTHDQEEAFEIADLLAVMNDGRIEQVDRPEIVYHAPASRFVADFVGQADFLPVRVSGGLVTTELGVFDANGAPDGDAEIMVRPEDIAIARDGNAVVVARRFRGAHALATVRLPSGNTVTAAHSSQTLFTDNEQVRVTFAPDHVVLFRGEEQIALTHLHDPHRHA